MQYPRARGRGVPNCKGCLGKGVLPKRSKPALFKTKIAHFHTCFQTRPLKSIPLFHSWPLSRLMSSLLKLQCKQKNSSNPFRIRMFLFLSYSFGIKTINTFIHSRSSLENHTRFQTKMGKVYTRFQTKTAHKPMGRHMPIWLI